MCLGMCRIVECGVCDVQSADDRGGGAGVCMTPRANNRYMYIDPKNPRNLGKNFDSLIFIYREKDKPSRAK